MQRYTVTRSLGDGTYGSVVAATLTATGEAVAIKRLKKRYASWDECLALREVRSLRRLHHPHIVALREVVREGDGGLFLVFEAMEGNLYELGRERGGRPFDEAAVRSIVGQALSALAFMHGSGFFHRDLKPENLLVAGDTVKLADFGLARETRDGGGVSGGSSGGGRAGRAPHQQPSLPPLTEYVSTRWYRAPEVLLRSPSYGPPVDVFAVGAIMAELLTATPLLPGASEPDQIYKLCALLGTPTPATWPDGPALAARLGFRLPQLPPARLTSLMPHASPEAVSLLEAMLRWDPAARPTAAGCFAHPFFARHMPVPGVLGLPPQLAAVAAVTGSGGAAVAAVEARGATAAHHRQQQSQQLGETRLIDGDRVAAAASPSLAGAGGAAAQHPGSLPPARGGAVDVTESLLAAAAGPGRSPAAQAEPPAASAVGAVGVAAKRPRSGGGNGTGASSGPAAASSPLESSVASLYATRSNDGRVQPHGPSGSPQPLLQQRDVPATMAAKPLATASVAVRAAAQAGLQQQPRRSGAGGGGVSPLDIDGLLAQFEASRPTAAAAAAPAAPSSYRLSASGGAAAVGRVSSAGSRLPPTSPLRAASGGGDEMPSLSEPPARRRPPVPPQLAYQQQQYLYQQPPPFPNAGASAPAAPHGYAAAHGNSNSFGHVADVTPAVVRALQHAPATRYGSSAGGGGGGGDNVGVVDPYTRLRAGSSGSGGSSGVGTYSCAGPSRTQPNQQYQQQPQQQQRGGYDGVGGGSGSAYASPALNPAPAGRRSMTQPQPQQVHPFQAPPLAAPSFGGGLGLELGFAGIGSGSSARLGGALPAAAHQPQSGTARSTSIFSSGGSSSSYSSRDEAPLSSSLFSQPTYGGGNGGGGGGGGVFGTFGRGATATAIPPLAAPTAGRRSGGGGGGSIFDSPGRLRDEPQLPPPPLSRQQQQQYGYLHPHHQQQQPPAAVAGYVSSSGVAMSGAAAAQQYQQQQQHGRYQQL